MRWARAQCQLYCPSNEYNTARQVYGFVSILFCTHWVCVFFSLHSRTFVSPCILPSFFIDELVLFILLVLFLCFLLVLPSAFEPVSKYRRNIQYTCNSYKNQEPNHTGYMETKGKNHKHGNDNWKKEHRIKWCKNEKRTYAIVHYMLGLCCFQFHRIFLEFPFWLFVSQWTVVR